MPTEFSEPTRTFFNTTADAYSGLFADRRSGATYAFRRRVAEVSSLSAAFSGRLLDCAVGSGEVTAPVLRAGRFQSATLVDFSPAMLKRAQALIGTLPAVALEWCESDCFTFLESLQPESFDLLLCLGLIAHTGRLEELMGLLRRAVAPGGGVLFQSTLANHKGIAVHRLLTSERYFRTHGYRISYQTFDEVVTAAQRAGFTVREVRRYCFFIPFVDRIWPWANYWIERALDPAALRVGSEAIFLLEPN